MTSCWGCGGQEAIHLGDIGPWVMVRCRHCGVVYNIPKEDVYEDDGVHQLSG